MAVYSNRWVCLRISPRAIGLSVPRKPFPIAWTWGHWQIALGWGFAVYLREFNGECQVLSCGERGFYALTYNRTLCNKHRARSDRAAKKVDQFSG